MAEKNIQEPTRRDALRAGVAGLGTLLLGGCSQLISEFNPLFKPAEISSTHQQRDWFELGRKIEGMATSRREYQLDGETGTLYVDMAHYNDALAEFGLTERGTFNELFETNEVRMTHTNPKTRESESVVQMIPNDGTIDTPFGDRVNAFGTMAELDEKVTNLARDFYQDPNMQVVVTQEHNNQDNPPLYLGFVTLSTPHGADLVPRANFGGLLQQAALVGGMARSKYLMKIDRNSNDDHVRALLTKERKEIGDEREVTDSDVMEHPMHVRRVIAYGYAGIVASQGYDKISVGDESIVIGVYNDPLKNANAFLDEVTQSLGKVADLTGQFMGTHSNLDLIRNKSRYLPQRESRPSGLGRFTGQVNEATDAINSVRDLGRAVTGGN